MKVGYKVEFGIKPTPRVGDRGYWTKLAEDFKVGGCVQFPKSRISHKNVFINTCYKRGYRLHCEEVKAGSKSVVRVFRVAGAGKTSKKMRRTSVED